jgi:putative transposase
VVAAAWMRHIDCVSQYAAKIYREVLDAAGLVDSIRQRGNSYDNTRVESFMKTRKIKAVYPVANETFADVAEALLCFIEEIYNSRLRINTPGSRSNLRHDPSPPQGTHATEASSEPTGSSCDK